MAPSAATSNPAEAPHVTSAASFRVSWASRAETARCNSNMSTNDVDAARMASSTGWGINDPPSAVNVALALITRRTPRSVYVAVIGHRQSEEHTPELQSREK